MMRKFVSVILLSVFSAGVMALGLGNIQLNSGLNQPFDARIQLLSPTASELDSLTVALASVESFERAGIDRAFILGSLRFEVVQGDAGQDYVHVTSREPLREPFLNFLVEASWANGRLYREYTVLLDPPLYDPYAGQPITSNSTSEDAVSTASSAEPVSTSDTTVTPVSDSGFTGNEVGPIAASETLWSVASRVRPDSSVSVNQMMLALFRANPEAFIGNNINGLKQGQILRVPEAGDINSTSYEAAIEEVRSQNALWEDIRGTIASTPSERPVSALTETATQADAGPVSTPAETGSELRLLAPGEQGTVAGTASTATANVDADLGLMNEQVESLTSENSELRERLTESETIIQDLKRLIELKDDELATLQQQMGGAPAASGDTATTPEATSADDQAVENETAALDESAPAGTETATEAQAAAPEVQSAEVATEPADTTAVAEEPAAEEPSADVSEETVPEPAPVAVAAQTDTGYQPGLIEQILGFVFGNLALVGGGLVVVLLLAMVPSILRKRKEAAAEADQTAQTAFPDFENSPQEGASVADGPQMDMDIDKDAQVEAATPASHMAETLDHQAIPVELAPAAPEVAEEDPLAEVNVFLAYEHFDSAEEFVRDAISRQPGNLDFHSKLLEVFYSAGDKAKYEAEARVLYDLVNGSGPHWDMATIMWQEMSPNRALFSEPAEGEDDVRGDVPTGGGIVDLTADDTSADDAGLDFDLGMTMDTPASTQKSSADDDMLDITAGSEDMLDVTAAVSSGTDDEDILDVTAAVGLETMQERPNDDRDIMDMSISGTDDLLDVTAHSDLDASQDEDVLDISLNTPATSGTDSKSAGQPVDDDNLLDFDIGSIPEVDNAADNGLDMTDNDGGIELDFGTEDSAEEGSLELSMDSSEKDDDNGLTLDFETDSESAADDGSLELSMDLDVPDSGDSGLALDFESDDSAALSGEAFELDIGLVEESTPSSSVDIDMDMDSTVKIPKGSVMSLDSLELDNDDDDDDHTVFVARTNDAGEQSADDENATKLDLAKAYVELGDSDNAKSILEEVIAGGNPAQQRQAQELMAQID
jgi:pilus assembly protein FimV